MRRAKRLTKCTVLFFVFPFFSLFWSYSEGRVDEGHIVNLLNMKSVDSPTPFVCISWGT